MRSPPPPPSQGVLFHSRFEQLQKHLSVRSHPQAALRNNRVDKGGLVSSDRRIAGELSKPRAQRRRMARLRGTPGDSSRPRWRPSAGPLARWRVLARAHEWRFGRESPNFAHVRHLSVFAQIWPRSYQFRPRSANLGQTLATCGRHVAQIVPC